MGEIHIYGAGMAGLLTATMMRHQQPIVHEAQTSLPDNHGALLRFRSDIVERETGQQFKRVPVIKAIKSDGKLSNVCTLRDANMYSYKVTGEVMSRSVLNLSPCERFIAPPDFLEVMARSINISLGDPLTMEKLEAHREAGDSVISTIPMPVLHAISSRARGAGDFTAKRIDSARVRIGQNVNVYQTIYYPGAEPYYRASITGNEMIVEYAQPVNAIDVTQVLDDFGITSDFVVTDVKEQKYGKLVPYNEEERQRFILHMTDQYRVYSVGRFATWRQILLDDVVGDVRQVMRWINQRTEYDRKRETGR